MGESLIAEYLREAEAGRVLDPDGLTFSPAGVRRLRRALAHVEAAGFDPAAADTSDAAALERLGRQVIDAAGLPPSRLESIVVALRGISAYVTGTRRVAGAAARGPEVAPAAEGPTPTFAMLALGERVGTWTERIVVIAFVVTAIGLVLELA